MADAVPPRGTADEAPERIDLPADPEAARRARRWVDGIVSARTVRGAEAALLMSEVVSDAIARGGLAASVPIRIEALRVPGAFRFESAPAAPKAAQPTPIGLQVVDALARRWGYGRLGGAASLWFEVRAPAAAGAIGTADDEELLARAMVDPDCRAEVFRRYSGLASHIAARFRRGGVDPDDLQQVAAVALVKAMSRFEPSAGAFPSFASATISGELKRYLRDRAWAVRVPRSTQEAALEVSAAEAALAQRIGGPPTSEQVAEETGLSEDVVIEARRAWGAYRPAYLDAPMGSDNTMTLLDGLGEDGGIGLADRWHAIAPAIADLPERLRRILYLRFYEDLTQTQIAEMMGISQMHVSRLLADAIRRVQETTGEAS